MEHAPRPAPRWAGSAWAATSVVAEVSALIVVALAAAAATVGLVDAAAGWTGVVAPLLVLIGIAVAYRRPWAGLVPVAAAPIAAALVPGLPVAAWSMVCFAAFLFSLKWMNGLLVAAVLAPLNLVTAAIVAGTVDVSVDPSASIFGFAVLVAACAGSALKGNVRYRRETERRLLDAERSRVVAIERSVAQERLRIARDLHDSVGHQVAVVNMHLGAAEVSAGRDAEAARSALHAARASLQAVLHETQQILIMLREGQEERDATTPGYRSIPELVDGYRAMGLAVEARIDAPSAEPPSEVSIAAYRIVQESLTNAYRYGDGDAVLTVATDDRASIRIDVTNRRGTRERPLPGGGNGLIGMRERAESAGGTLEARWEGPRFHVSATLPLRTGVRR